MSRLEVGLTLIAWIPTWCLLLCVTHGHRRSFLFVQIIFYPVFLGFFLIPINN